MAGPATRIGKRSVDVLFVLALRHEFDAARDVATNGFLGYPGVSTWMESDESDLTPYELGEFVISDGISFTVALARQLEMGGDDTSRILGALVDRLRPACLAMSGVCAGRPGEVALGDLIIADAAYQRLRGKMTERGLQSDNRPRSPSPRWLRAASDIVVNDLPRFALPTPDDSRLWFLECLFTRRNPVTQPNRDVYFTAAAWREALADLVDSGLIIMAAPDRPKLTDRGRERVRSHRFRHTDWPQRLPFSVHVGPMASGPYVDVSNPWQPLTDGGVRKVIGLEMEAASLAAAAYALERTYWIVCKGVSDHATKNKDERYMTFAAHASAELVWKFLVEQRLHHPDTIGHAVSESPPGPRIPVTGASLPEGNLPATKDSFVGRDDLHDRCVEHLGTGRGRLLTLVGPPGAGKTRLAVEVGKTLASVFAGRVYLVDLSVVASPDLVFASITESLEIEVGDPVIDALRELFRDAPSLLILDNFEQVGDPAIDRVEELLRAVPELTLMVTSDEPLRLEAELAYDVPPLRTPDAERLFLARSALSPASPAVQQAVSGLCGLLDGLPLAIELVAAHAAEITPQLLQRFTESSDFIHLKNLMRHAAARHETVESAIQWSFDRLRPEEQLLFVQLAVFDGGWTSVAAAEIVGEVTETLRGTAVMRPLIDKRLIFVDDPRDAEPRFRMLVPLREFGRGRLAALGDQATELDARHSAYFLRFAESTQRSGAGLDQAETFARLSRDHGNIHAALDHFLRQQDLPSALRMANALDLYWWSRNYAEGSGYADEVLALPVPDATTDEDRRRRAWVSFSAGKLALRQFRLTEARQHFSEVQVTAVATGDRELQSAGLEREALVDIELRRYDEAGSKLRSALAIDDADGRDSHAADCLDGLGIVAVERARFDYAEALSCFDRAIERYPIADGLQPRAWVRVDRAQVRLLQDHLPEARADASYAYNVGKNLGDKGLMMWAGRDLGLIAIAGADKSGGDPSEARRYLTQSLTDAMLLGNMRARLRALEGLAVLAAAVGRPEASLTLISSLDQIRDQISLPRARSERALIEPAVRSARERMSDLAQTEASDAGELMTLEQATEFARGI